jgi:hypothetical protein
MIGDHGVQPTDALHTVGNASPSQHMSMLIDHARIMMRLSPIHTHEDHPAASFLDGHDELEETRGALMDQCSRHDIPPAVSLPSGQPGPHLAVELEALRLVVLTGWLLEASLSLRPVDAH